MPALILIYLVLIMTSTFVWGLSFWAPMLAAFAVFVIVMWAVFSSSRGAY